MIYPFSNIEPKLLIQDKIFFIPQPIVHDAAFFPAWEDAQIFGRKAPIFIEYCTGNGEWILEKATRFSAYNWIAVEKKFVRVKQIWSKMKKLRLDNLFIVCGEGLAFSTHYVRENSFEEVYVNFPDPWPKQRHAKHRLVQEAFLTQMARISKKNAKLTIVTDHLDYAEQISSSVSGHSAWIPFSPLSLTCTKGEDYGTSFFDQLWRKKGRKIHYLHLLNNKTL